MGISFDHIVKFYNVGVVSPFQNFDLSENRLLPCEVFYFIFLVNFEGNSGIVFLADAEEDQCIGSLSDWLADGVIIHAMVITKNY